MAQAVFRGSELKFDLQETSREEIKISWDINGEVISQRHGVKDLHLIMRSNYLITCGRFTLDNANDNACHDRSVFLKYTTFYLNVVIHYAASISFIFC